jgi:hypothetical protein
MISERFAIAAAQYPLAAKLREIKARISRIFCHRICVAIIDAMSVLFESQMALYAIQASSWSSYYAMRQQPALPASACIEKPKKGRATEIGNLRQRQIYCTPTPVAGANILSLIR